jgi:Protein of unknown function (DUF4238)
VSRSPKKKNNHFVPRSYLRRVSSLSERQIGLYNIPSDREVEGAPIRSQCSRDYFYTKDPSHENRFAVLEREQARILDAIIRSVTLPPVGSDDRKLLDTCLMFQASRTARAVANSNHLANEFGKAMLKHHFERTSRYDLLEYLPKAKITINNAVFDSIRQHLLMTTLIEDLNCTLVVNRTAEDFLTSDHPVTLCNSLPASINNDRSVGFASRGLIILYPIAPHALLMWSDAEVYRVAGDNNVLTLSNPREVVDLNLVQFTSADENVYFADKSRVQQTTKAFRRAADSLRPPPPSIKDTLALADDRRRVRLLRMERQIPRFAKPRAMTIGFAASKGRFRVGDQMVRDPLRASIVEELMREVEEKRQADEATLHIT